MATQTTTRVRVADFDMNEFLRNPFHIRKVAGCPKCGALKGERCRLQGNEHQPEQYVHAPARKYEAIRVIQQDIERLKIVEAEHEADYRRHDQMVETAERLDAIGVTPTARPDDALVIYRYALKRGEVPDVDSEIVRAAQKYRFRNFS